MPQMTIAIRQQLTSTNSWRSAELNGLWLHYCQLSSTVRKLLHCKHCLLSDRLKGFDTLTMHETVFNMLYVSDY